MNYKIEDFVDKWARICEAIPYDDGYLKDEYLADIDTRLFIDELFAIRSPELEE